MLIKMLASCFLLSSCISVWPDMCDNDWRGRVTCKCNQEIRFKVRHTQTGKQVTVLCDSELLPISADSTQVTLP